MPSGYVDADGNFTPVESSLPPQLTDTSACGRTILDQPVQTDTLTIPVEEQ